MADKLESERRIHVRVLVRVLVDFESPDTYLYDYSNNLSEGGIFIETEKPLSVGSPLTLRFTLPGVDRVFEAKGGVVWVNDTSEGKQKRVPEMGVGMGIQFNEIDDTDRKFIREYVEKSQKDQPST